MLGPFDLPGPAFLQLYLILLVLALVAGFMIPRWLRPEGNDAYLTDPDELAFLAGGSDRFAETVTMRMLTSGAMAFDGASKFALASGPGVTPAERSVLALGGSPDWRQVRSALDGQSGSVEQRLVDAGLMMDRGTGWQMRFWQTLPYLLLLVFGTIKLEIGIARDKPVGFLTALLIVTVVFAMFRFVGLDRLTRGGRRVLAKARETSDRLKRAPTSDEAALGVALFGTAILAGSDWAPLHRMRASDGGSSNGSDSSSSDGGSSGCGGGGCGGCGGS